MFTDSFEKIFGGKNRILVVMPHPDDADLYCGSTIARLTQSGKRVRVIKMTYGDKGCKQAVITSEKLRSIRKMEDRAAMHVLGIKDEDNIYLGIGDGEIEPDLPTIGKVALQIRLFKPQLIITTNPQDIIIRFDKNVNWVNHRDHRHCGQVAVDAAYPYARDRLFFPEHFKDKKVSPHVCSKFLFTDVYDHPDLIYIDVKDFFEFRTRALASHSSQYSLKAAQDSTDFFTKFPDGTRRERFRYVIAD